MERMTERMGRDKEMIMEDPLASDLHLTHRRQEELHFRREDRTTAQK